MRMVQSRSFTAIWMAYGSRALPKVAAKIRQGDVGSDLTGENITILIFKMLDKLIKSKALGHAFWREGADVMTCPIFKDGDLDKDNPVAYDEWDSYDDLSLSQRRALEKILDILGYYDQPITQKNLDELSTTGNHKDIRIERVM